MSVPAAPDTPAPPSGNPDALASGLKTGGDLKSLMGQRLDIGQKQQKAITDLGTATAQEKTAEAQGNAQVAAQTADQAHGYTDALNKQLADNPLPTYVPTQETAKDIAGMFGLIAVLGTVMGSAGGGQQSALRAMNAMTGMLNGWQEGRTEAYDRNRQDFEENLKVMKEKQQLLIDAFNRNMELLPVDAAKANAQMQVDLAKFASPLIQKQFQVQGWEALGKTVDGMIKGQGEIERLQLEQERVALERQRAATGGRQSVYATLYTNNLATAANEISASIGNIRTAPAATSGLFQGRNTASLLDSPLGVLTNSLTKQATQMYNNEMQSLGRNIAKIQAGGRIVPESTQKDFEKQFTIMDGDKPGTVLEKLARARQATERAIQIQMVSPFTTPELRGIYGDILDKMRQDIPFTVDDVNAFVKSKNKQQTFGEFMQSQQAQGLGGPRAPGSPAPATKFTVGQIIPVNGKQYRVTGGDLNGDPDIEPVQ